MTRCYCCGRPLAPTSTTCELCRQWIVCGCGERIGCGCGFRLIHTCHRTDYTVSTSSAVAVAAAPAMPS